VLISALLALLVASPATAQNVQVNQARAELQAGRDQIVREDLQLTEEELAAFWPVYEEYVAALAPLRDRKAELITKFVGAYRAGEFPDDFSNWLIKEHFDLKAEWLQVQKSFVPRFREVVSVQHVARFIQLENKMDAEVDAQLAITLPLVE
jgi:hypothetical protein